MKNFFLIVGLFVLCLGFCNQLHGDTLGEAVPDGETMTVTLPGNVKTLFRRIPAGEFIMGSPSDEKDSEDNEGPLHKVTISQPFYMGVYEVTQAQWQAVMGNNPSELQKSLNHPVETVSWYDCQGYIARLNQLNLGTFRLPTEEEWEYACRAGTTTRYYWGDDPNDFEIGEYAWYTKNSDGQTNAVGQKKPNVWGLYDMSGNVWEWCWDWYGSYDPKSVNDPLGKQFPAWADRVTRGGCWGDDAEGCRSADRTCGDPEVGFGLLGFRLVLSRSE